MIMIYKRHSSIIHLFQLIHTSVTQMISTKQCYVRFWIWHLARTACCQIGLYNATVAVRLPVIPMPAVGGIITAYYACCHMVMMYKRYKGSGCALICSHCTDVLHLPVRT